MLKYIDEVHLFNIKELQETHITNKAIDLENALYEKFKQEMLVKKTTNYLKKGQTLYSRINSNKELRENILNDELSVDEIVNLNDEQLISKELREKKIKKIEEDFESRRNDYLKLQNKEKEGFYTCFRCKTNKTFYYQMQTRRADEGMTTFVHCLNCNNNWKC